MNPHLLFFFPLILFCFDYYHHLLVVLFYDIQSSSLLFSVILILLELSPVAWILIIWIPFIILAVCNRFGMKCMVDS